MKLRPVVYALGLTILCIAPVMMLVGLFDLNQPGGSATAFFASAGVAIFVGIGLSLGTRSSQPVTLDLRQAFLLTASVWVVVCAIAAMPFVLGEVKLSFTDAFFETMSGLTTTGSTVMVGLDAMSPAILLWRAMLQGIGGAGIVVVAIIVLPFLRVGGMQLFRMESSDRSERLVPRANVLIITITSVYVALIFACFLAYMLAGMTPFDALCHAMPTIATGGLSTHDASFAYFQKPALEWIGVVFMFAGATPFVVYVRLVQRRDAAALFTDPQIRGLFYLLFATSLAMALWLSARTDLEFLDAWRLTAFNVASVVTTTGFASTDYTTWGPLAIGIFFALTFIGGCAGSTAGGVKIYRWQLLASASHNYLVHLLTPHRMVPVKYDGKHVSDEVLRSVFAFLAIFLITFIAAAIMLTGFGLDLVTALSSSVTALTNTGPGLGPIVGPAGNFATLPDGAKWILSLTMLVGRLEFFTIFVLFEPSFWRS